MILVGILSFTVAYFVLKSKEDNMDEMRIILSNQDDNIVKRILHPKISYKYNYQINTTLDSYIDKTDFNTKYTTTNYDVEYVCTNISEQGFEVLLIYRKTTKFDEAGE